MATGTIIESYDLKQLRQIHYSSYYIIVAETKADFTIVDYIPCMKENAEHAATVLRHRIDRTRWGLKCEIVMYPVSVRDK